MAPAALPSPSLAGGAAAAPEAQYGEQQPPQWSSGKRGELHIHGWGWAGVALMGLPTPSRAAPAYPHRDAAAAGGRWFLPRASAAAARPRLPASAGPGGRRARRGAHRPRPPLPQPVALPPRGRAKPWGRAAALSPPPRTGSGSGLPAARCPWGAAAAPSGPGTGAAGRRGSSRCSLVGFTAPTKCSSGPGPALRQRGENGHLSSGVGVSASGKLRGRLS